MHGMTLAQRRKARVVLSLSLRLVIDNMPAVALCSVLFCASSNTVKGMHGRKA